MDTQRANSILYVAREMLADIKHCNGVGKLFPPGTWWRKGEKFFLAHGDGVGSVYDGQGKSVAFMIIYPAKDSNVLWAMVEKYPYSRDSDNGWEPIEGCPFPDNEDIRQGSWPSTCRRSRRPSDSQWRGLSVAKLWYRRAVSAVP